MLSTSEVAELTGISLRHVKRLAASNKLPCEKTVNSNNRPKYLFPLSGLAALDPTRRSATWRSTRRRARRRARRNHRTRSAAGAARARAGPGKRRQASRWRNTAPRNAGRSRFGPRPCRTGAATVPGTVTRPPRTKRGWRSSGWTTRRYISPRKIFVRAAAGRAGG